MAQKKRSNPSARKPAVVIPALTPPRGSPFAGISKTGAPARVTQIPHLTAQVQIAKARQERLTQGGLLTPEQRAQEQRAAKTLAKPETRTPQTAPKRSARTTPSQSTPPLVLGAPPAALSAALPNSTPARTPRPPARRGAPTVLAGRYGGVPAPKPTGGIDLGFLNQPLIGHTAANAVTSALGELNRPASRTASGAASDALGAASRWAPVEALNQPAIGRKASADLIGKVKPAAHAIDVGIGTAAAAGNTSAVDIAKDPGKWVGDIKKRGWVGSAEAASEISGKGLRLPDVIPSGDIVPKAGAATTTAMTPQELVAAGISKKQTALLRKRAIEKMHWYPGEIDGLVGLDLIKHAYSSPPPLPIRVAQNFGADVIGTAGLVNVVPALAQEAATGHGLRAVDQLGEAVTKQGRDFLSNPAQAFISHPYSTAPIIGGGLKTLGEAGRLINRGAPVARDVALASTAASTGRVVNRGVRSKNLYTATGETISDVIASRSPRVARRIEARAVDDLVRDVGNDTAPLHHGVQSDYAKTFNAVGAKRAQVLAGINKSGNAPEKILAKYTRDGNKRQIKYWTRVVEAKRNLSEKDSAYLAAHRGLGEQTTSTHVELGRFSDTAGLYRAYQPLILSDARRAVGTRKHGVQVRALHEGDPLAQRVQELHDTWVDALRKKGRVEGEGGPGTVTPEFEAAPNVAMTQLFDEYDAAVREYAQRHLAEGGAEPTRVAYTPPPPSLTQTSQYRKGTGGRVRFNARVPKQKASMGGSFESGNYLIDPKVALRENLQAQRLRTSVGLTSDESLAKIGAIKATQGEPRPEGYTFTPAQNPATVGKVISDLHDQPVGAHDYYHQESTIRDRFTKHLEHNADDATEYAATDGWFVPTGAWKRILDYTRPESRNAYDKFMRQYQRTLISIYPSTMVGNTLGSTPMAMAAGAGPMSFRQAQRSSSFRGDPTIVPYSIHGRGVAGSLAADARNPISRQLNRNRRINVIGEDYSRDAVYFSHVLPGSSKRAKELGYPDRDSYFRDLAAGKVDKPKRDAALEKTIKFVGDQGRPATKLGKQAGRVILFPQWVQHMSKLMLFTLPVHHPRRMALINGLAEYGDQYRKEHGAIPSWMQDFYPLLKHVKYGQEFTLVAGLGQGAPQGTAAGPFDTLSRSNLSWPERVAGLANPVVAGVVNSAVVQPIKNIKADYPVDLPRYAAAQALRTIPGWSKFYLNASHEPDSLPGSERKYTIPYVDADGHKHPVSWEQRTGARPLGSDAPFFSWENLAGVVSRVGGAPLYEVPAPESAINKRDVGTRIYKAKHPKK